jgi:hypothetical protein
LPPVYPGPPTRREIEQWTHDERAQVARVLDELVDRPAAAGSIRHRRQLVLAITGGGVLVLVGWIAYLTTTLPESTSVGAWRTAWVGFDTVLIVVLGASAWLVWHRRQLAVVGLTIAASLLAVDAWFDVCLSWHTPEQWGAVAIAALVEVPVSVVLATTVVTILRRTFFVVQQLRGQKPEGTSLWQQPVVMLSPGRE